MGAREKLNKAYFQGSLIVAALIGLVIQSGPVFLLTLALLLASNLIFNEIRFKSQGRHGQGEQ